MEETKPPACPRCRGFVYRTALEDLVCAMCGWHEWSDVEESPVLSWPRQGTITDRKVRARSFAPRKQTA